MLEYSRAMTTPACRVFPPGAQIFPARRRQTPHRCRARGKKSPLSLLSRGADSFVDRAACALHESGFLYGHSQKVEVNCFDGSDRKEVKGGDAGELTPGCRVCMHVCAVLQFARRGRAYMCLSVWNIRARCSTDSRSWWL